MKNLSALLVIAVLVLLLFAGCTGKDNQAPTNAPETTAPTVQDVQQNETVPVQAETEAEVTKADTVLPDEPSKAADEAKPTEQPAAKPDNQPTNPPSTSDVKVSKDEAKKAVLAHAGLAENEISRYKSELDRERGGLVYEIEFDSGRYEYDYEVDANSGKIIKSQKEFKD